MAGFQVSIDGRFWVSTEALGIPAVAIGATLEYSPHRLEENAEAGSIVRGVKSLIALAVALTSH